MPLASVEALRFAAAALSESHAAPVALVRLMAALPVAVSAPLLVRSPLLGEIDLIALIGRLGLAHARAIARRPEPGPRLAALLASLRDDDIASRVAPFGTTDRLSVARERLRSIGLEQMNAAPQPWRNLRDTALSGSPALFQTALADALDRGFAAAGQILASEVLAIAAFRTLGLAAEQAFLLVNAHFPGRLADARFIRQFLADYEALDGAACAAVLDDIDDQRAIEPARPVADNGATEALRLRAS
ncbi:MAG: hypothetical protein IPL47_16145 [Phyllobacteriaceae bacterium]|nr:hypothetical protein [Phyllobacteriaceae bacterium]